MLLLQNLDLVQDISLWLFNNEYEAEQSYGAICHYFNKKLLVIKLLKKSQKEIELLMKHDINCSETKILINTIPPNFLGSSPTDEFGINLTIKPDKRDGVIQARFVLAHLLKEGEKELYRFQTGIFFRFENKHNMQITYELLYECFEHAIGEFNSLLEDFQGASYRFKKAAVPTFEESIPIIDQAFVLSNLN